MDKQDKLKLELKTLTHPQLQEIGRIIKANMIPQFSKITKQELIDFIIKYNEYYIEVD
jgi:hypothetical protein